GRRRPREDRPHPRPPRLIGPRRRRHGRDGDGAERTRERRAHFGWPTILFRLTGGEATPGGPARSIARLAPVGWPSRRVRRPAAGGARALHRGARRGGRSVSHLLSTRPVPRCARTTASRGGGRAGRGGPP